MVLTRCAVAQFPPPGGTQNPYAELLYGALAEHGIPRHPFGDLTAASLWRHRRAVAFLHFHWRPDRYYARCLDVEGPANMALRVRAIAQLAHFAWVLTAARLLRYRIVWTVHEVYPPRRSGAGRGIDRVAQRLLARATTLLMAHDEATANRLRAELGAHALTIEIVPHGPFIDAYPPGRAAADVRRELGIPPDAFVFLCFGQLRADKQVGLLLDAFAPSRSPDRILLIAGAPADSPSVRRINEAARADARVRAMLRAIPHERVAELFGIADAFVLARGEIWTSGSVVLALSLGVPVLAARLPQTEALLGDEEAGWLCEPDDVGALARALDRAASDRAGASAKGQAARARAQAMPSWQAIARRIAGLMGAQGGS